MTCLLTSTTQAVPSGALAAIGEDRIEVVRGVRKAMVKSMTAALKVCCMDNVTALRTLTSMLAFVQVPHFGYSDEVCRVHAA